MQSIHDRVCRAANKISLQMDYLATAKDPEQVPLMLRGSVDISRDLLSEIDPTELRLWVEHLTAAFMDQGNSLTRDASKWSAFVARACDRLHEYGLHEKSIKMLGNVLNDWNCRPQTYDDFATALDDLDDLVSHHSDGLIRKLQIDEKKDGDLSNAAIFGLMHNCLAVVFGGILEATTANDPHDIEAATTVSFGCAMFNQCLGSLQQAMQHTT